MFRKTLAAIALSISIISCRSTQSLSHDNETVTAKIAPPKTHRAIFRSMTISKMLDVIDQRKLPLDTMYNHENSGKGVTVYVFDGGIPTNYSDLNGKIVDRIDTSNDTSLFCNLHGLAVATAIAGTFSGVAPNATLVDVKIYNCSEGRGSMRALDSAVTWVIHDHLIRQTPAVANWSLDIDTLGIRSSVYSQVHEMLQRLIDAGITPVLAAGNLPVNSCKVWPFDIPDKLVVSGILPDLSGRDTDLGYGPCVDLYAPEDQFVALPPAFSGDTTLQFESWTGTSFSTAYVSGAAALYLETHPMAEPMDVVNYLKKRASTKLIKGDSLEPVIRMLYVGLDSI